MNIPVLKMVVRALKTNPGYTLINILGLTLGMTSFFLIMLFVRGELSYDQYHEHADRIYRLALRAVIGDTRINQTTTSSRMFREMTERFPEIEKGVKLLSLPNLSVRSGANTLVEPLVIFADSTLFDIFSWPLVQGSPETALNKPNTLVISDLTALKYFGQTNPVGQHLTLDLLDQGIRSFEVTGVFREIPEHSHLHASMFASLISFPEYLAEQEWSANNFVTYFLLKPGTDPEELTRKFTGYTIETMGPDKYQAFRARGDSWDFFLQPLTSIHLKSDLSGEFEANGNSAYVYIFTFIAFFVLIIAGINFMNLATAKATLRAREVGIRKISGSSRSQLIRQFLGESVILTLLSVILSLVVVWMVLPAFSAWLGKPVTFHLPSYGWIIPLLILFGILTGLLSGIYPALFISAYNPVKVLKTNPIQESRGIGLRNLLVIIQFTASIFLLIGTLVVSRQLHYIQEKDLGYDRHDLLTLHLPASFPEIQSSFCDEVKRIPGVIAFSASGSLPGFGFNNLGFEAEGIDKWFTLNLFPTDAGLQQTLRLEMAEGRFFSPEFSTDSSGIILNETAVKVLGLTNPIGKWLKDGNSPRNEYHVIGVVKDLHYEPIHASIRPFAFIHQRTSTPSFFTIRHLPGQSEQVLREIQQVWNRMLPGTEFRYTYPEQHFSTIYRNEIQTRQVFLMLMILAVIVALLGLLGLTVFITRKRIREIAIRKISGASIPEILALITRKFMLWTAISVILASAAGWWVMERWLEGFTFRIPLGASSFILSGMLALVVVLTIVCLITFRIALLNPAQTLKYE